MLKIRRQVTIGKKEERTKIEKAVRGPFLTEDSEFDGGKYRSIVITLNSDHMLLRHARGKQQYPLHFHKALAVARRDFLSEKAALKKKRR